MTAVLAVLAGSGNTVAMKRMATAVPAEHMFFVNILSTFLLAAAFYAAFAAKKLPAAATDISKDTLAKIAVFDTLQMVLMMVGAAKTPGQLQSLLVKATIPLTLVSKYVALGTVPSAQQLGGAALIVTGAAYAMSPRLFPGAGGGAPALGEGDAVFILIFVAGCVPAALGGVYKEVALTSSEVDDDYLNAWVAGFQSVFTVLCLPLYSLDVLGDDAIPLDGIAPALRSGFSCIVQQTGREGCASAWVYVAVWLGMMYVFNALMTRLISQSGATLMFAVSTLNTPLTNLAFSLPVVMGDNTEPFSPENFAGMALIVIGILIFKRKPKTE